MAKVPLVGLGEAEGEGEALRCPHCALPASAPTAQSGPGPVEQGLREALEDAPIFRRGRSAAFPASSGRFRARPALRPLPELELRLIAKSKI